MAILYTMSDIYGCLDAFQEILETINLGDADTKLILPGDYIDHGYTKPEVYDAIKKLQDDYPNQVIALMGNHDAIFLGLLRVESYASDFLMPGINLDTAMRPSLDIINWILCVRPPLT